MRHTSRLSAAVASGLLLLAATATAACAGGDATAPPPNAPSPLPPAASTPAPRPEPPPSSQLARSGVKATVHEGLGRFLQKVDLDVDHPVMKGGKFHGFRILALKGDPAFWDGVDIKPGDVVVRVNGFSVGDENEAHKAFTSLEVASELDVLYERDGAERELRYAIVDDR